MSIPYREVFEKAEETLLAYGAERTPIADIRGRLQSFKTYGSRILSDDEVFWTLTKIVFYSGFRAATVDEKLPTIQSHFPSVKTVSSYGQPEIEQILADPKMIRHRLKTVGCVENAKVIADIINQHGSFQAYLGTFDVTSAGGLARLKEQLQHRFHFLGKITVYHFLTDLGFPVLKPDLVISRIFYRLGATTSENDLQETVVQGQKFAAATGLPIRYVDKVFVAYGQVKTLDLGIDRGICLKTPRCEVCGLTAYCNYFKKNLPAEC